MCVAKLLDDGVNVAKQVGGSERLSVKLMSSQVVMKRALIVTQQFSLSVHFFCLLTHTEGALAFESLKTKW